MQGFRQQGNALIWARNHETVQIEPWGADDQFMLGPDLLVAPVLHKGARSRELYLPDQTNWTDGWSGETLAGGRRIMAEAPLERIPLYLRGNSTLRLD